MGLSLSHIVTQPSGTVPDDSVHVWAGGALLQVEHHTGRAHTGGGRRGKITGFSKASRLRLLETVCKVRKDANCLFLTLTIPDDCPNDGRSLNTYFRRFRMRVARRFPSVAAVWRLDVVERKSGLHVGEPYGHYHLLVWGLVAVPGLREWISCAWYEAVGSKNMAHLRAGTRLEVPRDYGAVRAYAAKLYALKGGNEAAGMIDAPGRFWGVLGRENIPWAVELVRVLGPGEGVRLLRIMRRWAKASFRKRGRRVPRSVVRWRTYFIGDGDFWAERLGVVGWLI